MVSDALSPAVDVGKFAERILGRPLWPHQLELARSSARYRVVCAGRQVGKSAALSVIALFEAATRRNILVLLVSAGEVASRRLLEECTVLAAQGMGGSVLDESKSLLTLSNGSRIMSVPASEKQIRGWSVDLLIVDEAAFVADEVWSAAEPAIIARPGSRVILTSTPFGVDHFFRRMWQRGMTSPDESFKSWHWPSSISPLIDEATLEEIRSHENPIVFDREYRAEWADASGLLLSPDEIAAAVLDYELLDPALAHRQERWVPDRSGLAGRRMRPGVVGGLDWGAARDAHALVLIGALDDDGLNAAGGPWDAGDHVFFLPWLEYHQKTAYGAFVNRVVEVASQYNVVSLASETNGVGAFPTEELARLVTRAAAEGKLANPSQQMLVSPVWTDARRKQSGFGRLKGLLQNGRMILPRHTELLKQLASLEMTESASGSVAISVPERVGHDDLAMALMQGLSCIHRVSRHPVERYFPRPTDGKPEEIVTLGTGIRVPVPVRLLEPTADWGDSVFGGASGGERKEPW